MTYLLVQFEDEGKTYLYKSPFLHSIGDLVLVRTWHKLSVVKVVEASTNRYEISNYSGSISTIVGVANLLEDLPPPSDEPEPPMSFLHWLGHRLQSISQ